MTIQKDRDDLWWLGQGWEDYLHWQKEDPKMVATINELIKEIRRDPWKGKGSPEPLKTHWSGWWSRRITLEHRLVYRLFDMDKPSKGQAKPERITVIQIAQCRYHYSK